MTAYRAAAVCWIDQAHGCRAEAVERMPEERLLAEHQAANDREQLYTSSPGYTRSASSAPCRLSFAR